jgi:hypothetical protein
MLQDAEYLAIKAACSATPKRNTLPGVLAKKEICVRTKIGRLPLGWITRNVAMEEAQKDHLP